MNFKTGDEVTCIDNTDYTETLLLGKSYTVDNIADYVVIEDNSGQKRFYKSSRFILTKDFEKMQESIQMFLHCVPKLFDIPIWLLQMTTGVAIDLPGFTKALEQTGFPVSPLPVEEIRTNYKQNIFYQFLDSSSDLA